MTEREEPTPCTPEPPLLTPSKEAWRGHWVWTDTTTSARNAYAYFRRAFESVGGTLVIDITADSFYWLYLDGKRLARGPARAPLAAYSFDTITVDVAAGRHCLAVMGHHIGESNASVMTGKPGVLADVVLTETTGVQDLSTGPDWRCRAADAWRVDLPCTMSHFGFWEDCDLSRIPQGWTQPGFAAEGWSAPAGVGTPPCPPWPRLCPRDIPLPRYTQCHPTQWVSGGAWQSGDADEILSKEVAARRREVSPTPGTPPFRYDLPAAAGGRFVTADFGRPISGYVELEFSASQPGQSVALSYDDLVDEDGIVNPERSYAHLSDRFILPGGPCRLRTAHPRGFRYLMLDLGGTGAVVLDGVLAEEETYPFDLQPAFAGPDPELDTFYRKSAETVRVCTTDAFTDCASRERVQWTEDLYMHGRVAAYAFGDTRMLRRAVFQAAQNALPDGRINGFFPSARTNCAFAGSSIMWLHELVDYWLFGGNDDVQALLPTVRRLLAMIDGVCDESGLIASWPAAQFWDWAPIEARGCILLTNAAYVWALQRLGEQALFRDALDMDLAGRATRLRAAAHARFWDAARGLYRDATPPEGMTPVYSQHANAMAVLAGICPIADRQALLERLVDPAQLGPIPVGEDSLNNENRPSPATIVPVGTLWIGHFLCQALFEADLDVLALDQMRSLWGPFDELPTFPETRIQHGNTFLCHGWAAGPAYLLPAYVLGAQPVAGGWSEVVVRPHAGQITNASGTLTTPHGPLAISWRQEEEGCHVDVNAPPGVKVEVKPCHGRRAHTE